MIPTIASLALLPLLAACATDAADEAPAAVNPTDSAEATATEAAHVDEHEHDDDHAVAAEEHGEAQPRILVTYADSAELLSLDGTDVASLASFDIVEGARADLGGDGRHAYLVDYFGGTTSILDTGTWAQAHGDHFHYFTTDATLLDEQILGATPSHVVGHDGIVAVFLDGEGAIEIVDEASLAEGVLATTTIATNEPHHGVAVPLGDQVLITETPDGGLPDTVVQVALDGTEIARYQGECVGLHGEVTFGTTAIFGCAEDMLVIDTAAHTTTRIAYPADAAGTRVGTFYGTGPVVGNWGAEELLFIDAEAGTTEVVNVGATIGAISRLGDDILVLTTDGVLSVLDDHGHVVSSVQAIDAFELPGGHSTAKPALGVSGDTVVISDLNGQQLVLVDAHEADVIGSYALAGEPTGFVIANAAPVETAAHDHDHEDEDAHDHDHDHDH
ncbi:hypothetical protein [Demequina pelophila]|uniref:hypothetical protein n=1 Tax=Demequina pelophila TaxID=1638984 RepID=UPI000781256F|nr:hypothetical protein [Demequina pelophila]